MRAHIIYGFTEDDWHGKRFVQALKAQSIDIAKNITDADYIIAHSGGCFALPQLKQNQVLMMIDPPYWPGRKTTSRVRAMLLQMTTAIRPGNQPFYRFYVNVRHFFSLFLHPRANWRIIRYASKFDLEAEAQHSNTILVRNRYDPWLTASLNHLQDTNPHLALVHLPGGHLHCWEEPDDYVSLLRQYRII